jgi:hypothetical protein
MSNYRYEDDIRAGLDQAKADAQSEVDDMPHKFSKYGDTAAKLADALEKVTCPDEGHAVSEAIVDLAMIVRRAAREWRKAKDILREGK